MLVLPIYLFQILFFKNSHHFLSGKLINNSKRILNSYIAT